MFSCNSKTADLSPIRFRPNKVFTTHSRNVTTFLLWGKSSTGDRFAKNVLNPSEYSVFLNNGNWEFFAQAFSGAGWVCAHLTNKSMEGGKHTLDLDFSTANCEVLGITRDTGASVNPSKIEFEFCESIESVNGLNDHQCADADKDQEYLRWNGAGYDPFFYSHKIHDRNLPRSLKYELVEYDHADGKTQEMGTAYSDCRPNLSPHGDWPLSGKIVQTINYMPPGDGASTPFKTRITVYPLSADCDQNTTSSSRKIIDLPYGSRFNSLSNAKSFSLLENQKIFFRIDDAEYCLGANGTSPVSLIGNGLHINPWLICNERQFMNLVGQAGNRFSFKLMKDIDLSGYAKGVSPLTPSEGKPDWYDCLDRGGNMVPFGTDPNTCAANVNGNERLYDGNGKKIIGMRILMSGKSKLGLVPEPGAMSMFRDMTFISPVIRGGGYLGVVTGMSSNSRYFRNILIENADIKSSGPTRYVGTLGGFIEWPNYKTSIENVMIRNTRIRSITQEAVGGLAGLLRADLKNVSVSGSIIGSQSLGMGGIAGWGADVKADNIKFEGFIEGASILGGLFGRVYDSSTINGAYVQAGIKVEASEDLQAGGLVGLQLEMPGAGQYRNAYFFGTFQHRCTANDNTCDLGNTFGKQEPGATLDIDSSIVFNLPALGLSDAVQGTDRPAGNFLGAAGWPATFPISFDIASDDVPRLPFETTQPDPAPHFSMRNECRSSPWAKESVIVQASSTYSRGTEDFPIAICNGIQFAAMTSYPGFHYSILNTFYAFEPAGDSTKTFSNSLLGNGNGIIGFTPKTVDRYLTWWGTFSGRLSDVKFFLPKVSPDAGADQAFLFATTHLGQVSKVSLHGLDYHFRPGICDIPATPGIDMCPSAGLFRSNRGIIADLNVFGTMRTYYSTSGLVSFNGFDSGGITGQGSISRVRIDLTMGCQSGTEECTNISGITASNGLLGSIEEVEANISIQGNGVMPGYNYQGYHLVTSSNYGRIEDIHLANASVLGHGFRVHGVSSLNFGTMRRIYSEARVRVLSDRLPPQYTPIEPLTEAMSLDTDFFVDTRNSMHPMVAYAPIYTTVTKNMVYRYPARWVHARSTPIPASALEIFSDPTYLNVQSPSDTCPVKSSPLNDATWDAPLRSLTDSRYFSLEISTAAPLIPLSAPYSTTGAQDTYPLNSCNGVLMGRDVSVVITPGDVPNTLNPSRWEITQASDTQILDWALIWDSFNGDISGNGPLTVWAANLQIPDEERDVTVVTQTLRNHQTPSQRPRWVFDNVKGMRLYNNFLEE